MVPKGSFQRSKRDTWVTRKRLWSKPRFSSISRQTYFLMNMFLELKAQMAGVMVAILPRRKFLGTNFLVVKTAASYS
jgi:hypothetical protein